MPGKAIKLSISSCCCCLVAKFSPALWHPMNCNPPGFSVHGSSQAKVLEYPATSFSRGASDPGTEPVSLAWQVDALPRSPLGSPILFCFTQNSMSPRLDSTPEYREGEISASRTELVPWVPLASGRPGGEGRRPRLPDPGLHAQGPSHGLPRRRLRCRVSGVQVSPRLRSTAA